MPEDHLQYARHSIEEERTVSGRAEDAQCRALVENYANGLPAMPSAVFRLNEVLSSAPVVLKDVSEVISGDLSIAAQAIRLACSETGAEAEILRLDDCVVLLGIGRLRDLVLTTPLLPSEPAVFGALNALWQHSLETAQLSERIAFEIGYAQPGRAYLAGLLHDLGKVPLILHGREHGLCGSVTKMEHTLVGAALAEKWSLPPYLVEVIKQHHDHESADSDSILATVVAAADQFTCRCSPEAQSSSAATLTAIDCDRALKSALSAIEGVGGKSQAAKTSVVYSTRLMTERPL